MSHDPVREASKVRDHLSVLDRPVVFLIGAGASASVVGKDDEVLIPAVARMTEICREEASKLGAWASTVWAGAVADLEGKRTPAGSRPVTIEDLLTNFREKIGSMGSSDNSFGATLDQLKSLEKMVSNQIAKLASPDDDRLPIDFPHDSLARWIGRAARPTAVEIFTTNYDTLIESALERERIPVFDGFVGSVRPFFMAASLAHSDAAPGRFWTRLWKVHGSVNWKLELDPARGSRIVRQLPGADAHLILPSSQKYDESRKLPYVAMLDRLSRSLTERTDVLLVVVGYSFGDQHINEILIDALESHPRMHVIALQYVDPQDSDLLSQLAARFQNVLVYGPRKAIVAGVTGDWQLSEEVVESTAITVDLIFDSDAVPEDEPPAVTGKFRLGDFHWLAKFLDQIAARRG